MSAPARLPIPPFAAFCAVGLAGYAVNWVFVAIGLQGGLIPLAAYALGWHAAMTSTWLLNRRLTFATAVDPSLAEWLRWWASQATGGAAGGCVFHLAHSAGLPAAGALGLSSLAGAILNFTLGRAAIIGFKPEPVGHLERL